MVCYVVVLRTLDVQDYPFSTLALALAMIVSGFATAILSLVISKKERILASIALIFNMLFLAFCVLSFLVARAMYQAVD